MPASWHEANYSL